MYIQWAVTSERDRVIVTEGHVTEEQKVHDFIFFCFLFVSVHSNTAWLFLICAEPFSPLLDQFWVLICFENPFVEYGIFFTFEFLRLMYVNGFWRHRTWISLPLTQITLPRKLSFSYSTNTKSPSLMLSGLICKLTGSTGSTT